jgi:hypothetical protein
MNDGRLRYHKDPTLKWVECDCKKGEVPNDMHAYWHAGEGAMNNLRYECPGCGQVRMYNPTFDMTIVL